MNNFKKFGLVGLAAIATACGGGNRATSDVLDNAPNGIEWDTSATLIEKEKFINTVQRLGNVSTRLVFYFDGDNDLSTAEYVVSIYSADDMSVTGLGMIYNLKPGQAKTLDQWGDILTKAAGHNIKKYFEQVK